MDFKKWQAVATSNFWQREFTCQVRDGCVFRYVQVRMSKGIIGYFIPAGAQFRVREEDQLRGARVTTGLQHTGASEIQPEWQGLRVFVRRLLEQ
jgi:hypothetical protein